ncbi:site-2 protease family protein [Helicobacter canis]|uniref:Site-2 protease family protein n=1 Tax=Helicobacter canis TaxID=29419 RepID=A0A5M9QSP6_9HELI|nr:site-2 protease family protein [Helicobacter canis]KAA8711410.1 site-2 protease family protein [Helicobacter canis]
MDTAQYALQISVMILALLISIIGHEIMHGLVAYHYGDSTAKHAGRLSINPIKHIDIVGSIIVPAVLFIAQAPFLFGWAKPVPIDIRGIIHSRGYGAAIGVALAGVGYNLALALFASLLLFSGVLDLSMQSLFSSVSALLLLYLIQYNVVLFVFNLLPIPPLDGSQALLFAALKFRLYAFARFLESIAPYGILIVFVILFIPTLSSILFYPATMLMRFLLPL